MPNDDTIKLLKECNAGSKMAITSINEVKEKAQNKNLLSLLEHFLKEHQLIEEETHKALNAYQDTEKAPNPMAEAMAWAKINIKFLVDSTDQEIAELMIDGCHMGIKSVSRYINQYPTAKKEVKDLADKLVKLEQDFMNDLRVYL